MKRGGKKVNLVPLAVFFFIAAVVCVFITFTQPTPHVIDKDKVTSVKIDAEGKYIVIFLKKEGTPNGEALLIHLDTDEITRLDAGPPATPEPSPLFINKDAIK